MLTFDVNIKPEDYIKLNYRLIYTSPAIIIVLAAAAMVMLGTVTKEGFTWAQWMDAGILFPLCFFVYILIILPITMFYRIRGVYYRMAALNEPQKYTVDETGINIKGKSFETKNEWSAYKAFQIKSGWLILWKAKNVGNFIPLNSFKNPEDIEQLLEMASEKGIKVRGKLT